MSRRVKYYDLDVIISVGYRVHSKRGTAFRIWARKIIKDYLVKGYAINDRIRKDQIAELRQLVQVAGRAISNLYREDGSKRLADNTLVALTLMIAESKTEEKDVMVKVVVNLINQQNV